MTKPDGDEKEPGVPPLELQPPADPPQNQSQLSLPAAASTNALTASSTALTDSALVAFNNAPGNHVIAVSSADVAVEMVKNIPEGSHVTIALGPTYTVSGNINHGTVQGNLVAQETNGKSNKEDLRGIMDMLKQLDENAIT